MRVVGVEWLQLRRRVWLDKGYLRIGEAEAAQVALCPPTDHIHLYVKDKAGTATPYWKDDSCVEHEFADVAGIPPAYTDEQAQDAVGSILVDTASINFTYNDGVPSITADVIPGGVDHGGLAGLGDDDHPQYLLLAGRAGGQVAKGGTAASEALTLMSTAHATKGKILFGTSGYNESTNRLGIGTTTPGAGIEVRGTDSESIIKIFDTTGNTMGFYLGSVDNFASFGLNRNVNTGVYDDTGKFSCSIDFDASGGGSNIFLATSNTTNGTPTTKMQISSFANVTIGTSDGSPGTGSKCLLFQDGIAPSGMSSNIAGIYANDVGGTVQMFAINEADEVTQLSGRSGTYTPSNVTTDRSYDANATTLDEIADVLGTLIADLQTRGVLA